MKFFLYYLPLISVFTLSACQSHKAAPKIETFSLTPSLEIKSSHQLNNPIIRLMPASIAPEFSSSFFIYRVSNTEYLTDPYRRFLTSPKLEINQYLEKELSLHYKKGSIISLDNLENEDFILQEKITAIYADYREKGKPKAVTSIQFTLYEMKEGKMNQIFSKEITKETEIQANDSTSLLNGYKENIEKMSQEIVILL